MTENSTNHDKSPPNQAKTHLIQINLLLTSVLHGSTSCYHQHPHPRDSTLVDQHRTSSQTRTYTSLTRCLVAHNHEAANEIPGKQQTRTKRSYHNNPNNNTHSMTYAQSRNEPKRPCVCHVSAQPSKRALLPQNLPRSKDKDRNKSHNIPDYSLSPHTPAPSWRRRRSTDSIDEKTTEQKRDERDEKREQHHTEETNDNDTLNLPNESTRPNSPTATHHKSSTLHPTHHERQTPQE
ncbi:hypothetical protein WMY93_013370 [Mugilogobius chulae]|uniref:Uncharacterized protein n=1 Tax=Mugilogobius chulae TaxID=88201 RepID=A0AAW0P390_9GOBI